MQVSVVTIEELGRGSRFLGELDLYLKAGEPPGTGVGQFDARPRWNAAEEDTELEVVLDARAEGRAVPGVAALRPGTWFAGVRGGLHAANFTLQLAKHDCPRSCSGHGTCDTAAPARNRSCVCDDGCAGAGSGFPVRNRSGGGVALGRRRRAAWTRCSTDHCCRPSSPPTLPRGRYGGDDCSKVHAPLEYGKSVVREPGYFDYEYYSMPPITGAL